MSDKPNGHPPAQKEVPIAVVKALAYGAFGSQANVLVGIGMPLPEVINSLLDVVANMIAGVEPAQLRQSILNDIKQNLPQIVEQQWQMRRTTAGGIIKPT